MKTKILVVEDDPHILLGLEEVLKIPNVFVHIYGKKETRPGRKMGHVTILSKEKQELIHQVNRIKQTLKVITASPPSKGGL